MLMQEAVKVFGTKKKLAEVLGLAYQSVKNWGDEIPENRQAHVRMAIDSVSKGKRKKNQQGESS